LAPIKAHYTSWSSNKKSKNAEEYIIFLACHRCTPLGRLLSPGPLDQIVEQSIIVVAAVVTTVISIVIIKTTFWSPAITA
jgi:hypothetical protein